MKSQTFGVEVEMNNITRRNASKVAADFFGTGLFAYTQRTNGYQTWSAWDETGREWKFSRDCSIAGPEDEKCELVTPILKYEDMEKLQALIRTLRKAGAKSNPRRGCGIHVHIGAEGHTPQTIRNLVNLMASHEQILIDSLGIDSNRVRRYCKPVDPRFLKEINEKKPKTMVELADVWYKSQNCDCGRNQHYNDSRYHMLNLHATFTKGTIEFRLFQFDNPGVTASGKRYYGGLHAGQLKSYVQFCLALSHKAKTIKWTSSKEIQSENQKFAMRVWLVHGLGFIGDEFKTARDVFTRNLQGNSAWRYLA